MKYKGSLIKAPRSEIVAFPRQILKDGHIINDDIVFVLTAVLDFSEFNALCPEPSAPPTIEQGGKRGFDSENKDFKTKRAVWAVQKMNWLFLKTLEASPDFEWTTIQLSNPETWNSWHDELKEACFSPTEAQHLYNRALLVNSIDEDKMIEARERFLAEKRQAAEG